MRLDLPPGWEGLVSEPQLPDFGPILQAANGPLVSGDQDPFATLTRKDMGPGQVALVLIEYTEVRASLGRQPGENGTFEVEEPPIAIRGEDFQPSFEGVSPQHDFARRTFTINGRSFDLWVEFGEKPAPPMLLDRVNDVLTTLEVEPLADPSGYRTYTDLNDGLSITIPESWRFSEEPTEPIEPQNALALGSWAFPDGGVCAPFDALDGLPAHGAFVWLIEYHGTDHPEDFVPRPDGFDLQDFRYGETSCEDTPMYQLRFRDAGRFFQWQVAFGPQASEATRSETLRALDTLEPITCDAAGDAYVPALEPSSGSPGTQTTITGEVPHGEGNEGGFPADPTTWIEVWWNLDPGDDAWASALPGGEEPIAARPGPVFRLGRMDVEGSCTYEVTFPVPDVAADTYPVVVIQGGPEGASAFRPAHFEVTG
jgi:hypothetical protein